MILMLSLGFGLGVLAVVLAAEYERRRRRPMVVVYADSFANSTPSKRAEAALAHVARLIDNLDYQDSTHK